MKIFLKLLVINIMILPFTTNVIACKKNVSEKETSSNDVIEKLNSDNNETLNLDNTNNDDNFIDLNNNKTWEIIYNALNLNIQEQSFISSITSYNKIFYINNFKNNYF